MFYFAYGSNMSLKQMKDRCGADHFEVIGPAYTESYSLAFTRYSESWDGGVADLVKGKEETWGVIYKVDACALDTLDQYEGYDSSRAKEENAYNREKVTVKVKEGDLIKGVLCYFANPQKSFFQPSKMYLDTLILGAKENGLPKFAVDNISVKGKYANVQ